MAAFSVALTIIALSTFVTFNSALPIVSNTTLPSRLHSDILKDFNLDELFALPEQWITQKLNHFDASNLDTWEQRYFVDDSNYRPGGPVFLMILDAEEEKRPSRYMYASSLGLTNIVWKMRPLCLILEPRYFGKSHPKDLNVSNLRYLSSEQALADLVYFRKYMTKSLNLTEDTKWVAVGKSNYAGSLSAWVHLRYPHLIEAAVVEGRMQSLYYKPGYKNFEEYMKYYCNSLSAKELADVCNIHIQDATDKMELMLQDKLGWKQLTKLFRLCKPLQGDTKNDVSNLFMTLTGNLMTAVQYNLNNWASKEVPRTNVTIDTVCNIMGNDSYGDKLMRYAAINSLILDTYGEDCLEISFDEKISELRDNSRDSPSSDWGRQWVYQKCTEVGFFHTSDFKMQSIRSRFPLSFFARRCFAIFGKHFTMDREPQGVNSTLSNWSGGEIKASRVIAPNGSIDPWSVRGVLDDLGWRQAAIFKNGTAYWAEIPPYFGMKSGEDRPTMYNFVQKILNYTRFTL